MIPPFIAPFNFGCGEFYFKYVPCEHCIHEFNNRLSKVWNILVATVDPEAVQYYFNIVTVLVNYAGIIAQTEPAPLLRDALQQCLDPMPKCNGSPSVSVDPGPCPCVVQQNPYPPQEC